MSATASEKKQNFAVRLVIILATILTSMFCLRQAFSPLTSPSSLSLWALAVAATQTFGALGLRLTSEPASAVFSQNTPRKLLAAAIAILLAAASFIGGWVLSFNPALSQEIAQATTSADRSPAIVLVVAVIAGAAEELFFRLGLLRVLPQRTYVIYSTLLYGFTTLATQNIALVLMSVVLGATCAIATLKTHWRGSALLIHAVWTIAMVGVFPLFR